MRWTGGATTHPISHVTKLPSRNASASAAAAAINTQANPVERVRTCIQNLVDAADAVGLPLCVSVMGINFYGER